KWQTADGERRVKVHADGKQAHTIITLQKRLGRYSLLGAELRTGRTHQIRVHLASSGFPIVGDDKYGLDEVRTRFGRQGSAPMFLHACQLDIPHPLTGEPLHLLAPLPEACARLLKTLETRG